MLLLTILLVQFLYCPFGSVDSACLFPADFVGTWVTSHMGTVTVTTDKLLEYPTGKLHAAFTTYNFTCEENIDNQYMLKSDSFEIFVMAGANPIILYFYAYFCLDLEQISENKFVYYIATERDKTSKEFLFIRPHTIQPTMSDVCNDTTKQPYNHHVALRQGFENTTMQRCPSLIFGTYLYGATDECLGSTVDVCATKENIIFGYNESCTTNEFYSKNGTLDCVHHIENDTTQYLTVYNQDSAVDNQNYYQFSCLVIDKFEGNTQVTVLPNECAVDQTSTSVPSPGQSYMWIPTVLCPDTVPGEDPTWLYILIGCLVGIILLLLLVICIVCSVKKSKSKVQADEERPITTNEPVTKPKTEKTKKEDSKPEKEALPVTVVEENEKNSNSERKTVVTIIPEPTETKEYDKVSLKSGDSGFANDPVSVTPDKKPTDYRTQESNLVVVDGSAIVDDKSRPETQLATSRTSDLPPSTIPPVSREGTFNEVVAIPSTSADYVDPGPPSDRPEDQPVQPEVTIITEEPELEPEEKPVVTIKDEAEDVPAPVVLVVSRAEGETDNAKPIAEATTYEEEVETIQEVERNMESEQKKEEDTVQKREAEQISDIKQEIEPPMKDPFPPEVIQPEAPRVQTPAIPLILAAEERKQETEQTDEQEPTAMDESNEQHETEKEKVMQEVAKLVEPDEKVTPAIEDSQKMKIHEKPETATKSEDKFEDEVVPSTETVVVKQTEPEVVTKEEIPIPSPVPQTKEEETKQDPEPPLEQTADTEKAETPHIGDRPTSTPRVIMVREPTPDTVNPESRVDTRTGTFSELEYESGTTDWVTESETLSGSSEPEDGDDIKPASVQLRRKPRYHAQEALSHVLVTRQMDELKREKTEQPKRMRVLAKSKSKPNIPVENQNQKNVMATGNKPAVIPTRHINPRTPFIEQYRKKKAIEKDLSDQNYWNDPATPKPPPDDEDIEFEMLIPEDKHPVIGGEQSPTEKDRETPIAGVDADGVDVPDSKPMDITIPKMAVEPRLVLEWDSDSCSEIEEFPPETNPKDTVDDLPVGYQLANGQAIKNKENQEIPEIEMEDMSSSFKNRISNLFTRPRLKRNKRGRPVGGYVEDDYGPTKQKGVTKVEQLMSMDSESEDDDMDKQPRLGETPGSDVKSSSRSPAGKNVGFNVVDSSTTQSLPPPSENDLKTKVRADASSANRRLLRHRLFKAKKPPAVTVVESSNCDHLPGQILSDNFGRPQQELAPLVRTHGNASLSQTLPPIGTRKLPVRTESDRIIVDPSTVQMFREGLKKDQAVLSSIGNRLVPQTPKLDSWVGNEASGKPTRSMESSGGSPHKEMGNSDSGSGDDVYNKTMDQEDHTLFTKVKRKRFYNPGGNPLPMPFDGNTQQLREMSENVSLRREQTFNDANTSFMTRSADTRRTFEDRRLHMLLEELYRDKKYFDFYVDNTEPNSDAQANALGEADQGREFLLERADYWEERGPLPPRPPRTALGQRLSRMNTNMTILDSGRSSMLSSIASTCTPTEGMERPKTVPSRQDSFL